MAEFYLEARNFSNGKKQSQSDFSKMLVATRSTRYFLVRCVTEKMTDAPHIPILPYFVSIQAYHNSELRKEQKMPDHTFVPFKIRCYFPKG